MNYPDDFNTRTFPAGKSIAISRAMGVGILSAFIIIVCLCGLILWTLKSARVEPFILVTNGLNDQWRIIMAGGATPSTERTSAQIFQQSLIWHFTQNWLNISSDADTNSDVWNIDCKREYCLSDDNDGQKCAIYCASGSDLLTKFRETVLPQYQSYEAQNTTWTVVPESMRIEPVGRITPNGGTWQVQVTVLTGGTGAMDIVAYAKVAYSIKYYPATMGYYVFDFNAYRVSQ